MKCSTVVFARSRRDAAAIIGEQSWAAGRQVVFAGVAPSTTRHFLAKWSQAVDGSPRAGRWWAEHVPSTVDVEATSFGDRTSVRSAVSLLEATTDPVGPVVGWLLGSNEAAVLCRRHGAPAGTPVWLFVGSAAD